MAFTAITIIICQNLNKQSRE